VWAVQNLLALLKIPALVQGYQVVLPGGLIKIEDACSGLNLLLAALVLSVLQAEVSLPNSRRKYLVVALGIAIGIIDNWLRVFGLVAIAYYSNMQSPLVHDHISFGWWLFTASLVPFFLIARLIERTAGPLAATVNRPAHSDAQPAVARSKQQVTVALLSIALLSGVLYLLAERIERRADRAIPEFATPNAAQVLRDGWLPQYVGFDAKQTWRRTVGERNYDIAALLYRHQQPGKKLIYYTNRIAAKENIEAASILVLPSGAKLNSSVIHNREWRAVWWYYWIDGAVTTSVWQVKLLQLKALLVGAPNAALIALSVVCREPGCAAELAEPAAVTLATELIGEFGVVRTE
jgi:exosortase/archaeosortase family protein